MQEFYLTVITAMLGIQTMAFIWIVSKVWEHEGRINDVEDSQKYCPQHFKIGGSS